MWFLLVDRYVIVPVIGGWGIIAIMVAFITRAFAQSADTALTSVHPPMIESIIPPSEPSTTPNMQWTTINGHIVIDPNGKYWEKYQDDENSIWACRYNRTNVIVIINVNKSCPIGWSLLTWNIKGEQEPQGVSGNPGPSADSHWQSNGSELYYKAGNLGIGTDNPHQNLSVNGGLNIDQAAVNAGLINPGITFGSSSGEGISSNQIDGGNKFGLDFLTPGVSRMSITGGNVGVGTSNPTSKLHVNGKGTFTGDVDPPYISFS